MRTTLSLALVGMVAVQSAFGEPPAGRPVLRLATFTVSAPDMQAQVLKVADEGPQGVRQGEGLSVGQVLV